MSIILARLLASLRRHGGIAVSIMYGRENASLLSRRRETASPARRNNGRILTSPMLRPEARVATK